MIMTHPNIPKLAAAMDKSPAFKALVEANATPYGLGLLAKYRADQVRRSRWTHRLRLLTLVFVVLVILFVIVSFAALGWGFHAACLVC
jgi:hypothetical protein